MHIGTKRSIAVLAALAIVIAFLALNYRALDSYFQDDEFDNMAWTPLNDASDYTWGFVTPVYSVSNFRPAGALYFRWMTNLARDNFAAWVPSLFVVHLLNGLLLFLLLRKIGLSEGSAWLGCAFFVLSGAAMDAWWKPMYVFDLFCTTMCLASLLAYAHRRWVLSFVAFWLAYKSKELAVTLPAVLLMYEYWLGERKYLRLLPFLATSFSFGVQGYLYNPNRYRSNDYTFHISMNALKATVPYYIHRVFGFRGSALLLAPLLLVRDRRVWLGLAGAAATLSILLFLPGRRFEAYAYLPMACLTIAVSAAAAKYPRAGWAAFALWLPWNVWTVRNEQRDNLDAADAIAAFAVPLERFARQHPDVRILVYDGAPTGFHHWGVTGVWNYGHGALGLPALYADSDAGRQAPRTEAAALARWNQESKRISIVLREAVPERAVPEQSSAPPHPGGR
jgi:hypothetical protein